ncbi:MAG: SIS domain-containing protein, partial [Blastocatellia bacterium]
MTAAQTYFDKTLQLLNHVRETQMPAIERAAEICADSIANSGLVFLFGNGHSRMM